MAPTEAFTGSETVSTTEWSLTTDSAGPDLETSDGTFELWLDVNALVLGDRFELKLYEKVESGGSQRQVGPPLVISNDAGPHLRIYLGMLMHGWDVTLKKLSATDRAIAWSIRKV